MMKRLVTIVLALLLAAISSGLVYIGMRSLFRSEAVRRFVWNINTVRGTMEHLPRNSPKEDGIGSYAFTYRDYYEHLPRTVAQNASAYAIFFAFLAAISILIVLGRRLGAGGAAAAGTVHWSTYWILLSLGLWLRFFFAYHTTGNHDMVSWYLVKSALEEGRNVFASTNRYNYSPFWFLTLHALSGLHRLLPQLPFMFVVRGFLTLVDVATMFLLVRIASRLLGSPRYAAALFFLNPITVIITGYHGQFDNIPILFLLVSIYVTMKWGKKALHLSWGALTAGMIAKHEIIQQVLIVLKNRGLSNKKVLFYFSLSVLLFFLTFLPYWKEGAAGITQNVFHYASVHRAYGLGSVEPSSYLKVDTRYLYVAVLLLWPFFFNAGGPVKSSLIGMLLFLVLSPGLGAQQFVLPVALGAIQPSLGFYLFTLVTSLFLIGNVDELKVPAFESVGWNSVWFAAAGWLLIELVRVIQQARNGSQEPPPHRHGVVPSAAADGRGFPAESRP